MFNIFLKMKLSCLVSRIKNSSASAHPMSIEQPEADIGDVMRLAVEDLSSEHSEEDNNHLCRVLYDTSVAFKNLAVLRNRMIEDVTSVFIKPQSVMKREYEQLENLKKKLENRRLDYDARRRKLAKNSSTEVTEDDLRIAERKFHDLKAVNDQAMNDFISKDFVRAKQVKAFCRALLHYHRQCVELLENLDLQDDSCIQSTYQVSQTMVMCQQQRLETHSPIHTLPANCGE